MIFSETRCPWHLISFLSRIVIEKTRKRCKKQPVLCGFNPSDNAYEPLKLMHTVIDVINEVCFNYKSNLSVQNTRQNMAVSNPLPPPEAVYNVVSVSALKNSRRKMEDRLVVIHDLNTIFTKQDATPSHYYAVFDGHDGEQAAAYSANHLHQYLAESTNFTTDPEQAIQDAFCKTDSMFLNKCETENFAGGTTAVCALLLPKEKTLYIAWAGDSQAALVSQGKILQCVRPHKPDREDERSRIEKDGGMVIHWGVWRVNGQLGVSRAIGDAEYKPYVTAVPEIVRIPLGDAEDFFVLGSDGLWDHVPEIEVARVVYDATNSNPDKAYLVSQELVQLAKHNGSSDNISVIVVFLRDPHQIAAGPRWTNRVVSMDTLDNANNPFALPNKTNADSISQHNDEGLLLNITDGLKKSDDLPNNDLIKMLEKSNCERLTPEFDKDDNLGPETDVDNPEDGSISPNIDVMKRQSEAINNNQNFNPFNDIEKSLEINLNLKEGTFDGLTTPTEESCPLPTNSVHNVSQLIDAGAESDSDEEWNYVRGEEADKENVNPLQLNLRVAEEEENEDNMSQLNPNAAEFVPVSPTRAVPSPLGRMLSDEQVLSQSPKKPPPTGDLDLQVPTPFEFEKDISKKPHEIEEAIRNGHQNDQDNEIDGVNALNNKMDEFHFGPNAAPFTPIKLLDQSEVSSTKAVYGDESEMTLGTSFNESAYGAEHTDFVQKDDPMSMSFHQDRMEEGNPFDLNKIHVLPDDVDEFISKGNDSANSFMNETLSDLEEHFPIERTEEQNKQAAEPVTDLDNEYSKNECSIQQNNAITPTQEDRIECSLEENRRNSPFEEHGVISPLEEEKNISLAEETFEDKELHAPIEEKEISSPIEEKELSSPVKAKENESPIEEEINSLVEEREIISLIEEKETSSPVVEKEIVGSVEETEIKSPHEEKEVCSPVEEKEMSSPIEEKLLESPFEENRLITPTTEDQMIPPVEIDNDFMFESERVPSSQGMGESCLEPLKVSTSCDNLESPQQSEPVTSEPSPNNDEFVRFETEKSAEEKTKENLIDNLLDLDQLNKVESSEDQCPKPDTTVNEIVNISKTSNPFTSTDLFGDISPVQQSHSEIASQQEEIRLDDASQTAQEKKEDVVSSSTNQISLSLDVDNARTVDFDSQPTPESDQPLAHNADMQCLLNSSAKSTVDTESVATADVSSFLERSLLAEVASPLSPNMSHVQAEDQVTTPSGNEVPIIEYTADTSLLSPSREEQQFSGLTSTPTAGRASSISPLVSQLKADIPETPAEDKTPKATAKVADKKVPKGKPTPSTLTKKTPTPRTSLGTAKPSTTPSPRPAAAKLTPKPTTVSSRVNSNAKTEAAPKAASKPLASTAPRTSTTTARVPLASRTKAPPATKSGETKTLTNGYAKPASRPATGTVKKTSEGSSTARSATSTGASRASSTTARVPLASARSATATAAPKPRPNTLKPAPSKTVAATKSTTAVKPATSAPRVPLVSKTSSLANKDVKAPITKTFPRPRPATEKQIKETANKLTASKTTTKVTSTSQTLLKTNVSRKTEEKVSGTKTATSRTTTTTTNTTVPRPPIRRPTKVEKPKENGVAEVVTEQIIVNNAGNELNGITTNGDQQFVKDNSPVDNKLIVDNLTETAAN